MIDLKHIDANEVKKVFSEFLYEYSSPAFGSLTKRDIDILIFMKLQKLGVISSDPSKFELVKELKITSMKAKNLIYESNLRTMELGDMRESLKEVITNPTFLKTGDKIAIQIENPLIIDVLKSELKELGYITEGSFSPDIVKLTKEAYIALFESFIPYATREKVKLTLIELGIEESVNFKKVLGSVLKKIAVKAIGEMGEPLVGEMGSFLDPIMTGAIDLIKEKFTGLTEEGNNNNEE